MRMNDMALPIPQDLQKHQQCTLKSMQTYLLRVVRPDLSKEEDLGSEFKALEKDAEHVSKLDGVTQRLEALENAMRIGTESTMYGPYIKLANEILAQCHMIEKRGPSRQLNLDMLCVCSDPEVIFGTHADQITYRKPDLAYVHWRTIRRYGRQAHDWQEARKWVEDLPGERIGLDWSQVLMVDELKKVDKQGPGKYTQSRDGVVLYKNPLEVVFDEAHDFPRLVASMRTRIDSRAVTSAADAAVATGSKRKSTDAGGSSDSKRQKTTSEQGKQGDTLAKENDPNRPSAMVQTGTYASEMLSVKGVNGTHALAMLTRDSWMWLWYFDSAGAIQTQAFNVFAHTANFVLVLLLLQRFTVSDWGFPKEANSEAQLAVVRGSRLLRPETRASEGPASGTSARVQQGDPPPTTFEVNGMGNDAPRVMLVDPSSVVYGTSPVLQGRRTTVYDAKDKADHTVGYVAKWSYSQTTHENEAETVWIARSIVGKDERALRALPEVAAFKDFPDLSTDMIRTHLRPFNSSAESLLDATAHGNRILRCVFERKLEPLTYLNDIWFVRGMNDCIYCHHLLWEGVDPNTLEMKLRDFDLARLVRVHNSTGPQGKERTGTTPFMAIELLEKDYWTGKIERLYRHDLEGFVWVVAYYAWAYDQGQELAESPVYAWFTANYNQCQKEKLTFLAKYTLTDPPHYSRNRFIFKYAGRLLNWLDDSHAKRKRQGAASFLLPLDDNPSLADDDRDVKNVCGPFWKHIEAVSFQAEALVSSPEVIESHKRAFEWQKAEDGRPGRDEGASAEQQGQHGAEVV